MKLTTPTLLTIGRIASIPILIAAFYAPFRGASVLAATVFALAAITDWLDGYLARKYNQMSAFGAFLDPVADKLAVTIALFLLVEQDPTPLMALTSAVIVGREITISALREWMAEIGEGAKVKVAGLGKIKTIVQMVAITILLARHHWVGRPLYNFGKLLLVIAAVLTIWSAFLYLRAAWPAMKRGEEL